jgi:hypothetical protein
MVIVTNAWTADNPLLTTSNCSPCAQVIEQLPIKSVRRGHDRALFRVQPLKLGFAVCADDRTCVLECEVPASMSTQFMYTTYVQLKLSEDLKHVEKKEAAHCICQGGVAGDCAHVAAAMFAMQDQVFLSGRVPGETSRILSCTQQLQKWGVPLGNVAESDLLYDAEHWYPLPGVKNEVKQENAKQKSGENQQTDKQGNRRRSLNIAQQEEKMESGCVGVDVDLDEASRIAAELIEINKAAQLAKRKPAKEKTKNEGGGNESTQQTRTQTATTQSQLASPQRSQPNSEPSTPPRTQSQPTSRLRSQPSTPPRSQPKRGESHLDTPQRKAQPPPKKHAHHPSPQK